MATLTEVFLCFFLSCKTNAKVKPAKTGHGPHSFKLLCCSRYFLCCSMYFCVVLCIACFVSFPVLFVCAYMCTVLLPPGGYPIAVKYIIYQKVNVYLPSLRMKVPDHICVLGHSYTCHTLIKYNRYA
jgi:hypothetical protein